MNKKWDGRVTWHIWGTGEMHVEFGWETWRKETTCNTWEWWEDNTKMDLKK
jgi:hypothetical protein